jgi:hypothetical protein
VRGQMRAGAEGPAAEVAAVLFPLRVHSHVGFQ